MDINTACDLSKKQCKACEGLVDKLSNDEIGKFKSQINPGWEIQKNTRLVRTYKCKDFVTAMAFINKIALIAEDEGHHPDISISYNSVKLELTTHAVNGLTENDFILASKIDAIQ